MWKPSGSEKYQNSAAVFREDFKQEVLLFQGAAWIVATQTYEVYTPVLGVTCYSEILLLVVTNE